MTIDIKFDGSSGKVIKIIDDVATCRDHYEKEFSVPASVTLPDNQSFNLEIGNLVVLTSSRGKSGLFIVDKGDLLVLAHVHRGKVVSGKTQIPKAR